MTACSASALTRSETDVPGRMDLKRAVPDLSTRGRLWSISAGVAGGIERAITFRLQRLMIFERFSGTNS